MKETLPPQAGHGLVLPGRRRVISATGCLLAASGGVALLGTPRAAHGATAAQRGWRYCHKCHALFHTGGAALGTCPAGAGHEPAGYDFVLPHGAPATPASQRDWRLCRKCSAMFFDGAVDKGTCPAGGSHAGSGHNFALPHGGSETFDAQAAWRCCGKCRTMFYDGFPDKGRCPSGGSHTAEGPEFVLRHTADYPGKADYLARAGAPMRDMLQLMWRDGGRALVAEQVRQAADGLPFAQGVNSYDAQASIGEVLPEVRRKGNTRFAIELNVPGNHVKFRATAPALFGSPADPAFRVCFGILVKFDMEVRRARPPVDIAIMNARTHSANVFGAQAPGALAGRVAEYFAGDAFSLAVTRRIGVDARLRSRMAKSVASALDKVW